MSSTKITIIYYLFNYYLIGIICIKQLLHSFLCLLTIFNYIPFFKEHILHDLFPGRFLTEQEFEIHRKMNEFFFLGMLHYLLCFLVFLHRESLFVPVNRFCFFNQRFNYPGKCSYFLRKFLWRFVVLVKSHSI